MGVARHITPLSAVHNALKRVFRGLVKHCKTHPGQDYFFSLLSIRCPTEHFKSPYSKESKKNNSLNRDFKCGAGGNRTRDPLLAKLKPTNNLTCTNIKPTSKHKGFPLLTVLVISGYFLVSAVQLLSNN